MLQRLNFSGLELLVDRVLDSLPDSVWKDSTVRFLDPDIGYGRGIIARTVEKRLRELGYSEENISSRVYGYATEPVIRNALVTKYSLVGNYEVKNVLEEEIDMKFDVVVMNPPYQAPQEAEGKRGGGDLLWHKFVEASINKWTKDDGHICAVHPSGWRKPESDKSKYEGMFAMMAHDHHMQYLEIHDTKDGMKTFGAGTRYDWYVIAKGKSGPTKVKDQNGSVVEIDLKQCNWLPNHSFDAVFSLVGDDGEIIYDRGAYGTDKSRAWTKQEQDDIFKHPLVHSTTKSGNKFWYSSRNDNGHFGVSKAIFGESGINDVIIDLKGEYGMTQGAMAIPIDDREDAELLKEFLMSDNFKDILNACSWSNFRVDWRLFTFFRGGFWRD